MGPSSVQTWIFFQVSMVTAYITQFIAIILLTYHFLDSYTVHIPNRTFLIHFGGISGEFGRAKIPMARPNEPDMPPKRTKKVRLGIYRTQIQPKI